MPANHKLNITAIDPFTKGRVLVVFATMLVSLASLIFLTACGEEQTTGPVKVRWDREICARCAMAVSDRNYSAQVRGGRKDKKARVYKFDDVGCAIIWLDKQNWKDDPRTEIWVNDHRNGQWINAKTAWYVKMKNTPMDYGLGAQTEKVEGALNFEQAKKHIYEVEQRFNPHTGLPREVQGLQHQAAPASPAKAATTATISTTTAKDDQQNGNNDKK